MKILVACEESQRVCMAFRDNMPDGFYENSKAGDKVKVQVLKVDEMGRYTVEVIETL